PALYSASDLSGKAECKRDLLRQFSLPESPEIPLVGIVSRFTAQKGADLIAAAAPDLFATEQFNLVALGSGEPEYENVFRALAAEYPGRVGLYLGYNDQLAHRIEAGADIFLMPSLYEPCGLNQIYSLRYGTVPVVRATGGLDDSIDAGTGYKFAKYSPEALQTAMHSAFGGFANRKRWQAMMRSGMSRDFSWNSSAREYGRLYRRLLNPNANQTI
ncbi:MAG: glycosyltransferase, partial [Acidobacteriota bacterium]|nr:glycosyltransferase [Acidobacteriota bacterium]